MFATWNFTFLPSWGWSWKNDNVKSVISVLCMEYFYFVARTLFSEHPVYVAIGSDAFLKASSEPFPSGETNKRN